MPLTPKVDHNTILDAFKRVDKSLTPGSFYWAVAMAEKINKPLNICLVCSGQKLTMEGGTWDCTGWIGGRHVDCPACLGVGSFNTESEAKEAEKKYAIEHDL
jgi:hypothetical protein